MDVLKVVQQLRDLAADPQNRATIVRVSHFSLELHRSHIISSKHFNMICGVCAACVCVCVLRVCACMCMHMYIWLVHSVQYL